MQVGNPCHYKEKQTVLKERSEETVWVLTVPKGERQISGVRLGNAGEIEQWRQENENGKSS